MQTKCQNLKINYLFNSLKITAGQTRKLKRYFEDERDKSKKIFSKYDISRYKNKKKTESNP
jgi:hypothetical protein